MFHLYYGGVSGGLGGAGLVSRGGVPWLLSPLRVVGALFSRRCLAAPWRLAQPAAPCWRLAVSSSVARPWPVSPLRSVSPAPLVACCAALCWPAGRPWPLVGAPCPVASCPPGSAVAARSACSALVLSAPAALASPTLPLAAVLVAASLCSPAAPLLCAAAASPASLLPGAAALVSASRRWRLGPSCPGSLPLLGLLPLVAPPAALVVARCGLARAGSRCAPCPCAGCCCRLSGRVARSCPARCAAGSGAFVFAAFLLPARGCPVVAFSPRSAAFVAFSCGSLSSVLVRPGRSGAAWVLVAGFESLSSASAFARRAAIRVGSLRGAPPWRWWRGWRMVGVVPGVLVVVAWPRWRGSPAAGRGWGARPLRNVGPRRLA